MRHSRSSMPDYGVDAPRTGVMILFAVIASLVLAGFLYMYGNGLAKTAARIIFSFSITGIIVLILIWLYTRKEKFRHRNRMLNMLTWKGDEQVLDIGTGHGLLMIGAAKRLSTGHSVGVDIWSKKDLSNNSPRAAITNAKLEEVINKVTVMDANAQDLPLANSSFDYVLSNLCLHNIPDKEGRAKACSEIVRVLKPGGTALISDFRHTKEYETEFKKLGLETSRTYSLLAAPMFLYIVKAVKKEMF